jgi:hypothetical protein
MTEKQMSAAHKECLSTDSSRRVGSLAGKLSVHSSQLNLDMKLVSEMELKYFALIIASRIIVEIDVWSLSCSNSTSCTASLTFPGIQNVSVPPSRYTTSGGGSTASSCVARFKLVTKHVRTEIKMLPVGIQ